MKLTQTLQPTLALLILTLCGMDFVSAADVRMQLSTKEAYVGMPVVLQLSIENATDYESPTIPVIDGCDVRSAGAPSQSSQITIINGRRSESRSVILRYLITPRQEGTFEVPSVTIKVDGQSVTTAPQQFVATKSQTGDLLFVEIEGGKKQVYVGQPLDLILKLWIKPFQDLDNELTLSESHMWQMISESTSWGSFSDRIQELAENNQRPGGREVLRTDGKGQQRSYDLYEIQATVYPQRPGKIAADDVQIVVHYPTKLGPSRDPFGRLFQDSRSGRGSRLSQLMGEDFFSSPFSNRLTVTATRPIVGEATVDSTQVLPVPSSGRPADYRGAVGRYEIVTQATPTSVSAGDPITLNIGITGTGPMQFVQAPPLSELPPLTADFRVADQSLAGFVQDNTKLFSTTIRPRREGITQIPGIPFSFFDPEKETFETVMSAPIDITVEQSESLSLDAIVGAPPSKDAGLDTPGSVTGSTGPDLTNVHSAEALMAQSPVRQNNVWWSFVVVPPIIWLVTWLVQNHRRIGVRLPSLKSLEHRCLSAVDRATQPRDIAAILIHYVEVRTGQVCHNSPAAVGALRMSGLSSVANEVEAFLQTCEHSEFNGAAGLSLAESRQVARKLVQKLQTALASHSKAHVQRSNRRNQSMKPSVRASAQSVVKVPLLLLAVVFASGASCLAADPSASPESSVPESQPTESPGDLKQMKTSGLTSVDLSATQQQAILFEAGELYSRAITIAQTDSAEANDLFTKAAHKYQLLVDSGVQNALLYRNLGNAWLQCNQLGRAIANYERATVLAPDDRQLAQNLSFANSLVKGDSATVAGPPAGGEAIAATTLAGQVTAYHRMLIDLLGPRTIVGILITSSLLFWGLQIAAATGLRFRVVRYSSVPLLLLATSLTSVLLGATQSDTTNLAVLAAGNVTLHAADGDNFDVVWSVESAQGHRVRILAIRDDWVQIKTHDGHVGWVNAADVQEIRPTSDFSTS